MSRLWCSLCMRSFTLKLQDPDCEFQVFSSISRPEGSTHSCRNNEYVFIYSASRAAVVESPMLMPRQSLPTISRSMLKLCRHNIESGKASVSFLNCLRHHTRLRFHSLATFSLLSRLCSRSFSSYSLTCTTVILMDYMLRLNPLGERTRNWA